MSMTREAQAEAVLDGFKNAPRHTLTTGEINLLGGRQYNARVDWLRRRGHRIECGRVVPGTEDYYYRWFGQQDLEEIQRLDAIRRKGYWMGPETGFQFWQEGQP